MPHVYDVIIIGGGPAGYTAALYTARAGLDTLVIEKAAIGGQMALTDVIDNYPGFANGVDGFTLGLQMQATAERFGAKTEYTELIGALLTDNPKRLQTTNGELLTHTVIIATGAIPRSLGIKGEDELTGNGIHYCAHCDGRFYKDKTVVVVGGGNSAAEDALYLANLAKKVYLVHRRSTLRAQKVYHTPLLRKPNVEFIWNSTVSECVYNNKLTGVKLLNVENGKTSSLAADGVFVSIGRKPATELFSGILELDGHGYIIADESTRTNIDGVFAVGDVRTKPLRQVVTATADGAVAAHFVEEYISIKRDQVTE